MSSVNERPIWTVIDLNLQVFLVANITYYYTVQLLAKIYLHPPRWFSVTDLMVCLTYYCVRCMKRRNKTCEFRHPDNQCPEIYRICGKLSSNTLKSTKPKQPPKLSRRPIHNPLQHQESRDEKIWVTGHKALHHFIEGKWVDGYNCSVNLWFISARPGNIRLLWSPPRLCNSTV